MRSRKNVSTNLVVFRNLLCLALVVFMAVACSNRFSFQKRKYTKGYYFSNAAKPQQECKERVTKAGDKNNVPRGATSHKASCLQPEINGQPISHKQNTNEVKTDNEKHAIKAGSEQTAEPFSITNLTKQKNPLKGAYGLSSANHGISALGEVLLIAAILVVVLIGGELVLLIMMAFGNTTVALAAFILGFIDLLLIILALITLSAN